MRDKIINGYFEWLYDLVCGNRYSENISYRKLLMQLHNTEFIFTIPRDINRAYDGVNFRYRFPGVNEREIDLYLDGPCSVLEMMIALASRCEETIMDDAKLGDRTRQWFWEMITSLGLGHMNDNRYDKRFVTETIDRFLNRDYEPNGKGGLFTIRDSEDDLRDVEIWYQLCWYLDSITR